IGSSGSSAGSLCRFSQSSRTGFRGADCCADAVIGKVAAAPPRRAMNSRLFIVASPSVAGFSLVPLCGQHAAGNTMAASFARLRMLRKLHPSSIFGKGRSGRCDSPAHDAAAARHPLVAKRRGGGRHRSCDWSGFPTLRSEIRLAGLWDRKEALIEMIAIVLGTNHFMQRDFCRALVTPVALTCTPGHREGARVLHADKDVQRLAAIDQLKTLHNMELGRVRRTIVVDIGLVVEADCVDHQSIAVFVMTN